MKAKGGHATVGPYPTESIAVKASIALSILAMVVVIILGALVASLKSEQQNLDLMIEENNRILKQLSGEELTNG